ncbi:U-box domain-containing protein 9 [Phalaenopsis equestris]|uniref:U-box domain-containing protein 9 n=1 Tax=Phalaenopsis equestris TaxID=78828 RepID=UPI0009E3A7E7|nr:U-box domain-containing protein 9 [Phalaenopsis equestris]
MAKSGAAEGTAISDRRTAEELKKELRRLIKAILEEDEGRAETYKEASEVIAALKELRVGSAAGMIGGKRPPPASDDKVKHQQLSEKNATSAIESVVSTQASVSIPKHFLCPLSSAIMRDPVVLATGETYDRAYIQEWLSSGNRTCPQTQQVLSTTILTPNHLVRNMISLWCATHGVDLRPPENPDTDGLITYSDRCTFSSLLTDLSSPSTADRKQAVKSLRQLTKRSRSFRALVGEDPTAIPQLLTILSAAVDDLELREDAVTALLNLSIHDANKKVIGESNGVALLIQSMNLGGTMNTLGNAAAALFTLSALDSNKVRIGELGAMSPLIDLFETGSPAAKKDAASAIFNLCMLNENKVRAVKAGAVDACLAEIANSSSTIMDESLALLALLSAYQEAAEEVADGGGVPLLLKVLREGTSVKNVENAVVVLYAVCSSVRRKLKEVGEEEKMNGTISKLACGGTSRSMRKAAGILEKLKRIMHSTHYSC